MDKSCEGDPNCCPPAGSSLQSAQDLRRKRMNQEMTFAIFTVVATFGIWAVLIGLGIFSLVLLVKTILRYVRKRNTLEQVRMIDSSDANSMQDDASGEQKENNDNYQPIPYKPSTLASQNMYRDSFMKNLDKKSERHKQMNKTLNKFFRKNYNKAAPDSIDETVVLAEYDDW